MTSNTPRARAEEYVPPQLFQANGLCVSLPVKNHFRP